MSLHINASKGEIADKVILPGDPLRAKSIAENYLDDPKNYNQLRGMLGYTGSFNNKKVSVQGTGMGMPSISIYAEELIRQYGVKTMVRTGTCGAIDPSLEIGDIILVIAASTDSNMLTHQLPGLHLSPHCSSDLWLKAQSVSKKLNLKTYSGSVVSSDFFYHPDPDSWKKWADYGLKAVEMETAALYALGMRYKVECLSILTVSDCIPSDQHASSEERENSFKNMAKIALEI